MSSLLDAGLPVASSCGGEGVCAKCKIKIVTGPQHLSPPNEVELFLRESNNVPLDSRISCQTEVMDDIEVDASYW